MSYKKAEAVNRAVANTIYNLVFDVGRVTGYNIHGLSTNQPIAWFAPQPKSMEPISVKSNRLYETHQIQIFFYKQSQLSFNNTELFQIIKDMDEICTEFCIKLQAEAEANDVEVSGFQVSPIYYNAAKNLVSGVILSYTFAMPDDIEFC